MFRAFRLLFGRGETKKLARKPLGFFAKARVAFEALEDRTVPTTLAAGDIAVIGYNTNASPDNFTIVALKQLDAGTVFYVNDDEVASAGGTSFTDLNETEASFTVKVGQSIAAGTVISLPWGAAAVSTTTYDWSSTSGAGFGNNNEEIHIYTAASISATTPTAFIYGVAIGSSPSARPSGLTAGTDFIEPSGTAARYKTSGATYSGIQSALLAAIGNTASNWEAVAPGNTTDWSFSVGSGSNNAPTLNPNAGVALKNGAAANISNVLLQATDAEQAASSLTFSVTTATANGDLKKNGIALIAGGTFTQADINNSLITYVHGGGANASDSFAFTVSDGAGGSVGGTFAITVAPNVLLNEIKANPPGSTSAGDLNQYIELRGTPGAALTNVWVVMFNGDSGHVGVADYAINLTGTSFGSNGLLMIKRSTAGHSAAAGTPVVTDSNFDLNKHAVSFYAAYATGAFTNGTDYDSDNNGTLEGLPAGFLALDNVGWADDSTGGTVYGGVVLTQNQGTPDAATRIVGDGTTTVGAWFNGDLHDVGNDPAQLLYDATRHSANLPLSPNVASLTPGDVNFAEPQSDTRLRIVDYNIASSGGTGEPRSGYTTILQAFSEEIFNGVAAQVDLFIFQEVKSQVATSQFIVAALNGVYGAGAYGRGTLDGYTSGAGTQGVVYNTQTLQLLDEAVVGLAGGASRQTLRHHFHPIGGLSTSDFYVYNSHLKASDSTADAAQRLAEVEAIRANADALGQGANFIYAGDFNLYTSNEDAYHAFLDSGNGQAFDPISTSGNWHNNSSFVGIHTQAPLHTAAPGSSLTDGGLDDRFDFQLTSGELTDGSGLEYVSGSYHTFGNDGSVALNGNINDSSSTALGGLANRTTVLDLLTTVTDHLPVVADYTFSVSGAGSNTAPAIVVNTGQTVTAGTTGNVIGETKLRTSDAEQGSTNLTFTVTSLPSDGTLKFDGSAVVANVTTFTQADIAANDLTYDAPATAGSRSFAFSVSDGSLSTTGTFAFTVNAAASVTGVVGYATAGATISQDFDSLSATAGAPVTLTAIPLAATAAPIGATGMDGWYVSNTGTTARWGVDTGNSATASAYSYGIAGTNAVTDRALGAVTSSTGIPRFGAVIANTTGATLSSFTLNFTEEEWRNNTGTSSNNTLAFAYKVGGTGIDDAAGFTNNTSGDLAPVLTPGTAVALDGNASANRTAKTVAVSGLTWSAGTNLVIRWGYPAAGTSSQGLAIDDLTFSASATSANAAPTAVGFTNATTSVAENTAIGTDLKVADINVTDDGQGTNSLSLSGADQNFFTIGGAGLYLKAGTVLNFEAKASYAVTVNADDTAVGSTPDASANFTLNVSDVNDIAPVITTLATQSVAEGVTQVAALASTDVDSVGTNPATFTITGGAHQLLFGISGGNLVFNAAKSYEADAHSYEVEVTAFDGVNSTAKTITVALTDVNEAPTAVTFTNTTTNLAESTSTTSHVKVADIAVTDDALGTNDLSLSGADQSSFEIVGTTLYLKAGTSLSSTTKPTYAVTVSALDASVSGSTAASANFTLTIAAVNHAPALADKSFSLFNKSLAATVVGTVTATDTDAGQTITYSIVSATPTSGDAAGVFGISNAAGHVGEITVLNATKLKATSLVGPITLVVRATDNGLPVLHDDAIVTISLKAADTPAVIVVKDSANADATVAGGKAMVHLDEASSGSTTHGRVAGVAGTGTLVATLSVTDVDEANGAFTLAMDADLTVTFEFDSATGKVTVKDAAKLDFEKTPTFKLKFSAPDHGLPGKPAAITTKLELTVALAGKNDTPTIAFKNKTDGAPANVGQKVDDTKTIAPFASATIGDVDNQKAGQTPDELTVTIALDDSAKGAFTSATLAPMVVGGFVDSGSGVYTFTGTSKAATAAIAKLKFQPLQNRVAVGSTETTTFTLSVTDSIIPSPVTNSTTTVESRSINSAPTIGGMALDLTKQAVTDKSTIKPFTNLTIVDPDVIETVGTSSGTGEPLVVIVTLDKSDKGTLSGGGFAAGMAAGSYTFTGTAAQANAAIHNLTFTPTPNRVEQAKTEETKFTVSVADPAQVALTKATLNKLATVVTTSVNDSATITGATSALQATTDKVNLSPFAAVTIDDVDPKAKVTATIALDVPANGTLISTAFKPLKVNNVVVAGAYSFTGIPSVVTTAIRGVVFKPTANQVAPGSKTTTVFTISATDNVGTTATDSSTTVESTSVNDVPTISGAKTGIVKELAEVQLFKTVAIVDPDNQNVTVTVTLGNAANGTITLASLNGFVAGTGSGSGAAGAPLGTYTFTGKAADAQTAIRLLKFTPRTNLAKGATETTTFTISVSDGVAALVTDSFTQIVATGV